MVLKSVSVNMVNSDDILDVENEVKILSSLDHPNIIKYYKNYFDVETNDLVICMEYATNGTLHNFIKQQKDQLIQQKVIMMLFAQICLAIDYIHEKNIIHRDITAHNILLTGQNGLIVKLSDFGISKILETRRCSNVSIDSVSTSPQSSSSSAEMQAIFTNNTVIGTQEYIAPEICHGKSHTKCCDIWSLGCILYYMITLQLPFIGSNLHALVMKITNNLPDLSKIDRTIYDEELIDIICNLLNKEPTNRPKIKMVIAHPNVLPHVINIGTNTPSFL